MTVAFASYQAAHTIRVERQTLWGVVGVAGTVALGTAVGLTIFILRRAILGRLTRLQQVFSPLIAVVVDESSRDARRPLVASPSMLRYHREGCLMLSGKTVRLASREDHESAGRRPCGICGA